MKIAISGIGGLGGFFGGLLAKHYQHANDVEIVFLSRGENEKAIRRNGLQVLTVNGNFTAFPKMITSDASLIGKVDLLICCTKRYDLAENMIECSPCVNENTIILPLLNGVDSRELISAIFPNNLVLDGCVYLVARLTEPGIVMETGNISKLFFGLQTNSEPRLKLFLEIFKEAGIEATLSENIQQIIWEKFSFISPIATLTSFLDCSIGDIVADVDKKMLLGQLLSELKSIADQKGILLPENIYQITIDRMAALPKDSTSSMHSDFKKGKPTELESLTGYILKEAEVYKIAVPTYTEIFNSLQNR
ncbi:MAG TPA: 2-dehydropantoate 2-reductase [Saprospiraceae bacterium]|nr:2-dehydropantoate 2-reductase [Saprospiraceae bacterium]